MVFLGRHVDGVARVHQAGGALQGDLGRVQAHHLASHAAQSAIGARAQAAAVQQPVGPALACPGKGLGRRAGFQCICTPSVSISWARRPATGGCPAGLRRAVQAVVKASPGWALLAATPALSSTCMAGSSGWWLGGFQQARAALGFGGVLAVPDDQRAFLLKEHRLLQRRHQLGPARERVVAHAHHPGSVTADSASGASMAAATGRPMLAWGLPAVVNLDRWPWRASSTASRRPIRPAPRMKDEGSVGVRHGVRL
jgi:hypothetical protein